ncbi:F-box domain containing protein [Trema orientale]|uniref:F-box domain containing protein n=1 Tax=Trema orientale TaxID=63057 RepID=A0A2P5FIR7_TREOI|nr:F-box domain containing protein [Trema orientale]
MDQLPMHVVALIFSKLPTKTLAQLKCVCKLWSQIIVDHAIPNDLYPRVLILAANSSATHNNNPTYTWVKEGRSLKISSNLFSDFAKSKGKYHLENCCRGLLCFRKKSSQDSETRACLLNPLSQKIIELPACASQSHQFTSHQRRPLFYGIGSFRRYGLGFDGAAGVYKVVSISRQICGPRSYMKAEVYTLGTRSSSWRTITTTGFTLVDPKTALFSGGFVYWVQGGYFPMSMASEKMLDLCKIFAFEVGKEEFRFIPLPRALFSAPDCCLFFQLIDLKGALGLVDCSASTDCSDTDRYDNTFKIWMMEKYDHVGEGEASWVKQYTVRLSFIRDPCQFTFIGPWDQLNERNQVLLIKCGHSFISYNVDSRQWEQIHTPGLHHSKSDNRYLLLVRNDKRSYNFENPDTGHEYTVKTSRLADKDDIDTQLFCYTENLLLLSSIFKEN